jgi:DNA-binding CsgD family transcriptional regulator
VILLEREDALATVAASIGDAAAGEGRLVLVSGEAGAGKTSLLRAAAAAADVRVLWGNCDGLPTPRPLGPVLDVMADVDAREPTASRHEVFGAVVAQLSRPGPPTLLVVEDVHWADGATIDLLRYVATRVGRTRGVVAASYRDDDLHRAAALRATLGEAALGPAVRRIHLPALSRQAVADLAAAAGADGDETFRLSGGNPYLVSELLTGHARARRSVAEVIQARTAQLPPAGQRVVEAAAVMAEGAEPAVLIRLADGRGGLDAAVHAGLLVEDGARIRFRHELARQAVESTLTPERRATLHADVLAALLATGAGEPARCVHHAEAAGDREQVLTFARLAADRAVALGSHPEAAAQLERALRFTPTTALTDRAELLDRLADQYILMDRTVEARQVHDEAMGTWRTAGDRVRLAESLSRRAEVLRYGDDGHGSIEAARAAVELLAPLDEGRRLALARAVLAQSLMLGEHFEEACVQAELTIEVAERHGYDQARAHALITLGTTRAMAGEPGGIAQIEAGVAVSQALGIESYTMRGRNNVIAMRWLHDLVDGLQQVIEAEVDFTAERGMDVHARCMRACLAELHLSQGRWDEAADIAKDVATYSVATSQRTEPLLVLGTLRARRGDPEPDAPLEEALRMAIRHGEPQLIFPARCAMAESAWLAGDLGRAAEHAAAARDLIAHEPRHPRQPEAAFWCWRTGVPGPDVHRSTHPFAVQMSGRVAEAAAAWRALDFPYHEADALADSDDEDDLRRAWKLFDELGATRRAADTARRLRSAGARDLPRRRQASTRENPAGLTDRQLEIARMVAAHLTNQEIAERLFLSPRTVDHHVSAILNRLDVTNRRHAAQRCRELGILAS